MVDEDETMDVPSVGGRKSRVMARRICPRSCSRAPRKLSPAVGWDPTGRLEKSLNSGIVLTGGGAMLEGLSEIAEHI